MQRRSSGPIHVAGTGNRWFDRYVNSRLAQIATLIGGVVLIIASVVMRLIPL
jgi:hypothetical protein